MESLSHNSIADSCNAKPRQISSRRLATSTGNERASCSSLISSQRTGVRIIPARQMKQLAPEVAMKPKEDDEPLHEEIMMSQPVVKHQDTIGYSTALHLDDVNSTPLK